MMEDRQQQELQQSVWHSVQAIVDQEARNLGKTFSPDFTASLAEVVYAQMATMATDLEAFASHGKRSVISMEDVKLCARRNDTLHELLTETANEITEESSNKRKKK